MTALVVSEATVPVAPYQQVTGTDLAAIGTLGQGSLDNVVENILMAGVGYTGMGASQVGTSNIVAIQPGWLVKGGPAYALRDTFNIDVTAAINGVPDSAKTVLVAIVADGQVFPTTVTRTFVDASKLPTDPTTPAPTVTVATPTRNVRSVVFSSPYGAADVQPSLPSFSTTLCLIATVTVSNTAILSVVQNTDQQITRLDQIAPVVAGLSTTVSSLQTLTASLLSSVSSLTLSVSNLTAQFLAAIADLQAQINALKSQSSSAATAIFRGQDSFQNLSQSNPTATGYNAVVSSGLRFGTANHADIPFTPSSPYVSALQPNLGSFQAALYSSVVVAGYVTANGALAGGTLSVPSLPAYAGTTFNRYFGRQRTRVSPGLPLGSAAGALQSGDPSLLFGLDGSGFVYDAVNWGDWKGNNPTILHAAGFWNDVSAHGFWGPGAAGVINGLPAFSVPFTPSTPGMLTEIDMSFAGSGSAFIGPGGINIPNPPPAFRVLFCADNNGQPDFTNVFADVIAATSTPGSFVYNKQASAVMPYPIYYRGGKKYHAVFLLNGNYGVTLGSVAYGNQTDGLQNDYLIYANNAWAAPEPGKCIPVQFKTAKFSSTAVRVPLQYLNLAGAFDTIDLLTYALIPDGCQIYFEAYINNAWVQVNAANVATIFANSPQSLLMNMVLTGTSALMPVVDATAGRSTARASKGAAALDHVSSVQTPSGTVTKIHKSVTVQGWNSGTQTLTADLRIGTNYGTTQAPDGGAPTDVTSTDGSLTRSWTWTLTTAVSTFEMELIGATTNSAAPFVIAQSNWDAGN